MPLCGAPHTPWGGNQGLHVPPPGPVQGLLGRHCPPGDDPSLLFGHTPFFPPSLPQRSPESWQAWSPDSITRVDFLPLWGTPTHPSSGARDSEAPRGSGAGPAGKALSSGEGPQSPLLFPWACLNVSLKAWKSYVISLSTGGTSYHFGVTPCTLGWEPGPPLPPQSGAGPTGKALTSAGGPQPALQPHCFFFPRPASKSS